MAKHLIAAAAVLMVAGINGAGAQDYPARTVTIIVPFAAGGPADITGRIVADIFSRHLNQKFVVENVGGAGGTTGALRAARAPADGYTILSGHLGTNALAAAFYPNLGYDPQKDFEPIGLSAEYPEVLVVRNDFPANNLKEFVAYAKREPLTYAHAGPGSGGHLAMEYFRTVAGFETVQVPYRGNAPLVIDLVAGHRHGAGAERNAGG